jgi:hypothetical protein
MDRREYFKERRKQFGVEKKEAERLRSAKRRAEFKKKATTIQKSKVKDQTAARVRQCRKKKKLQAAVGVPITISPYGTKAAETKALQR